MSRRHRAEKRTVIPDIRYNSPLVAHLVNVIMKCGKKNLAQRIVYGAFEKVSEKLEKGDPVDLLLGALENARPRLEVKSRRVGGATYQVPIEISFERQLPGLEQRGTWAAASHFVHAPVSNGARPCDKADPRLWGTSDLRLPYIRKRECAGAPAAAYG